MEAFVNKLEPIQKLHDVQLLEKIEWFHKMAELL